MTQGRTSTPDVIVIGGGAIGLTVAWRAAERGLRTILLEHGGVGGGTSHHAAGMLAPVAEAIAGEESLLELGLASASAWPAFAAELGDVGYTACGTLLVARDADEAATLEREIALRRRFGLSVERLRASEARRREPGLAPTLRLALDVADDHAVDPRRLCRALVAAIRGAGGDVREGTAVAGVEVSRDRVTGVRLADGAVLAAGDVVIAAGAWAGELAGVGEPVPLRPVKGQILRLHDPAGPGLLRRVIRMGPAYVVPRGDGRYVIGATSEERGFDRTVTAGAMFELLRDASELVPGVSEWVVDEFTAGLRPGTPDNLPAIGPGSVPGLHWAVGHRRGGILLAPVTAQLVVDGLTGDPPEGVFTPRRFARAAA